MRNQSGFTLMELMITIAIMGIVSAIAVPNMVGWRAGKQLDRAAQDLYGAFNTAKAQAIRRNVWCTITFDAAGNYVVHTDNDRDGVQDAGETLLLSRIVANYPNVTYIAASANFAGSNTIMFSPDGLSRSIAGALSAGIVSYYYDQNRNGAFNLGTDRRFDLIVDMPGRVRLLFS